MASACANQIVSMAEHAVDRAEEPWGRRRHGGEVQDAEPVFFEAPDEPAHGDALADARPFRSAHRRRLWNRSRWLLESNISDGQRFLQNGTFVKPKWVCRRALWCSGRVRVWSG
jgi:hypothetical protein